MCAQRTDTIKKQVISSDEWNQRLQQVNLSKEDLNRLVLNYLIIEGHKNAAEEFCVESGQDPGVDLSCIQDRMLIRNAIEDGRIEEAMERVNELDFEILDTNPQLYFHLQLQRLIELIRGGDITGALLFAQAELAPRGEENPAFLQDLERALALLAFENTSTSPVADLLHGAQRQKTAGEMNAAILMSKAQDKDPKLPILLKYLVWAQNSLDDHAQYPKIVDMVEAEIFTPVECKIDEQMQY